jgi:hypothetical protein
MKLSKRFCDTSTGAATGAACSLVSCSVVMDERGGHKNLRGLSRQSVIPYVRGRTKLYCSSLPCLSLPFCPPP